MFIKNIQKNDIGPVVFKGYWFTLPANKVCSIWEEAGKFLLELFKAQGGVEKDERGKTILTGAPLPPVIEANAKDWDKKSYASITRFHLNHKQIPSKKDLLRIAEERGVDKDFLRRASTSDEIDNSELANEINSLPIPEEIRFPDNPDNL